VTLRAGEVTAFIGPNGAGKTTLLRLLAPDAGAVTLDGHHVRVLGRRALAQRLAFVPQDTYLPFVFTVREMVEMGCHPHLRRFERLRQRDHDIVDAAMRDADVLHLAQRAVTTLSGGERQRVSIVRSLATQADVLLLDEPTANLDIAHALDVLDLCQHLAAAGKTIGLAIHDINAAVRYAAHIVLMRHGRIVYRGGKGVTGRPPQCRIQGMHRPHRQRMARPSSCFLAPEKRPVSDTSQFPHIPLLSGVVTRPDRVPVTTPLSPPSVPTAPGTPSWPRVRPGGPDTPSHGLAM
jgi:iron complex transport system ATP-binding protein